MTSIERIQRTLDLKPVDQIGAAEGPWTATMERWIKEGHVKYGEDIAEHFQMDIRGSWPINCVADLDFKPVTLEENEETILQMDGNGAKLRRHKQHDSTPEHVDFTVKDRRSWEKHVKPHLLKLNRRRVNWDAYRTCKAYAAAKQRFFTWSGVAPFEQMHPVCGHEYMLIGMADDPDWIKDMVMTYARFTIMHLEELFADEGAPDGMYFYEDMGFKGRPFMSPAMYREILQPGHKLLFDWSHARKLKVIVHSCGFVEPLVPGLVEAGMNCLQAMEVKAGMDMRKMKPRFGDKIAFFGNIDVRTLISNDRKQIDAELESKIPPMLDGGYILHSDHSIPPEVNHETLVYFFEKGREISRKHAGGQRTARKS
jgi:uroporphyrinogen decarboxylase